MHVYNSVWSVNYHELQNANEYEKLRDEKKKICVRISSNAINSISTFIHTQAIQ